MTAKHKRNSANVLGVLLLSGLIGWLTGTAMLCRAKNPYVAIEDHGSLDFGTGDSSSDLWICPTDLPGQEGDPRRRFLSKSNHPRNWWGMDITSEGRISLGMGDSNRVNRASRTQSGIPGNAWSHVAVVTDRSNRQVRFYLNGQRDSVHELPADFTGTLNVPSDLTLGSTWQPFVGLLDEIRLFRRALGAAEIEAAYQRELGRRVSSECTVVEEPNRSSQLLCPGRRNRSQFGGAGCFLRCMRGGQSHFRGRRQQGEWAHRPLCRENRDSPP